MTGVDAAGAAAPGPFVLELDSPSYATADVHDLATGRSRRFELPKSGNPRLSLTTASGPLAVVLAARGRPPSEATRAATDGVTAVRDLTVEEILARHQVWRAGRDARWTRFAATNLTSVQLPARGLPRRRLRADVRGPVLLRAGHGRSTGPGRRPTSTASGGAGRRSPAAAPPAREGLGAPPRRSRSTRPTATSSTGPRLTGPSRAASSGSSRDAGSGPAIYAGSVYIGASRRRPGPDRLATARTWPGDVQSVDETTDFAGVAGPRRRAAPSSSP